MHVVAQHRILDPERFSTMDPKAVGEGGPPGVRGLTFYPDRDLTVAICLWETPSLEVLRDYLDPASAGVTENTYFAVDARFALGLPEAAPASA